MSDENVNQTPDEAPEGPRPTAPSSRSRKDARRGVTTPPVGDNGLTRSRTEVPQANVEPNERPQPGMKSFEKFDRKRRKGITGRVIPVGHGPETGGAKGD